MARDYYEILGVPRDATTADIKRAFRRIARECHPDVAADDAEGLERFKVARAAYETLMDPVSRSRYDRRYQRKKEGGGSFFEAFYRHISEPDEPSGPRRVKPRRRGRRHDSSNDLNLEDLFNDFGFGGSSRAGRSKRSSASTQPTPQPGADVEVALEVPADICLHGGSVTAVYYRMQRADAWRPGSVDPGLVRIQDIADVRIIPGTEDGTVLRERGLGDAGAFGGAYGDLVCRVKLVDSTKSPSAGRASPSPLDEQAIAVDISIAEALLGGRIDIDTPQGRVRLTVPPCTPSETRLRVRDKGPTVDGVAQDLFVQVRIVPPAQLDDASRRLIDEFARLNPEGPRSE